jgi:hypothetical protein
MKNDIKKYLVVAALIAVALVSSSCGDMTASAYKVNPAPYADKIAAAPDEPLVMDVVDVTPIGGFQFKGGFVVRTDQGDIRVDESGVVADVVVDQRSGK